MLKMISVNENTRKITTMAGTTRSDTCAMRLTPPMMTSAAKIAVIRPPMMAATEISTPIKGTVTM